VWGENKMRCKKCDLQVTDSDETVCPLCNTPLEEDDQVKDGELSDKLYEDQKLKELITAIADTVKNSLDKDKHPARDNDKTSFDLEKALSDEETTLSKGAAPDAVQRNEYEKSNKYSIKNAIAVSIVVLAFAGSVIAAYFYAIKEPQMVKETMTVTKAMPLPQNQQVAPPEINVPSQVQPKETTVQLQDKTASTAEAVSTAVSGVTKEQLPEQKPAEQPPPKAAEPAKMATTVTAEFYTVNVGSFKLKKNVDRVMKVLSKKGCAPSVETVTLNDKSTWYRVNVGQFKTREEAARFARELGEKMKLETMVVKMK
jgi:cell division septation protein DedD